MSEKIVRIGGASGFWGDSAVGAPQLVAAGVDYLVFDYLAELTMSILVNARAKDPALGYAIDFVDVAMKSVLPEVAAKKIKVISNAGGVNPASCARALAKLCDESGVKLKIAVVEGDDVLAQIPALRAASVAEMFSGAPLPAEVLSANAYLGALPIARALALGADVVITGRCVDSAVTLGALIHEFDWAVDDYDRLAQGGLAGHILECGCQATGGLFTDWESVPDWHDMGYPIAECRADRCFSVTKPAGTGGLISVPVLAEQMLYEIGDPAAYILPDVVCDFTQVTMASEGENLVRVSGARGRPPTDTYKVSATYQDGWRAQAQLLITGIDAAKKAQRTGEAILARTRAIFARLKYSDYTAAGIEVLGAEHQYGPHARTRAVREAVLRVAVRHQNPKALGVFTREVAPAGTSWSPGTTGAGGGGRGKPAPNVRLFSFLLPKPTVRVSVGIGAGSYPMALPPGMPPQAAMQSPAAPEQDAGPEAVEVPLVRVAHGRSGDKGNISNVGIIARQPEYLPLLRAQLTPASVRGYLAHLVKGEVTRYEVTGIHAFNFVMREALDGGGMASLRADPLGKGMAQILLDMPVRVPSGWLRKLPSVKGAGGEAA